MLDIFEFMLHLGNICSANQAQEILKVCSKSKIKWFYWLFYDVGIIFLFVKES